MNTRTAAVACLAGALLALTACSSSDAPDAEATPSSAETTRSSALPPEPTGKERQELLDALAEAAPDVVRYEDKAIDAARNQCSSLTSKGAAKSPAWTASQRFTYRDVTTTEEQGERINEALRRIGFCNT